MPKQTADKHKKLDPRKRNVILAVLLAIVLLVAVVYFTTAPERSVAAYCKVYQEEKARLAKLPGDTWPSGVFNQELSDASEFATSFNRLARVAPDDIRNDVETLRDLYQKIDDDPSQAIAASLSGVSAETNVKDWTESHCDG